VINTELTRYALGALCGILLVFGSTGPSRAASAAAVKQPPEFADTCAVCHGGSAEGTERAPSLVNNYYLSGKSIDAIAAIIGHGRGGIMPSFANLPAAQIEALATYVHSLNTNAFESRPPGNVPAGAAYFFGSGRCSECHIAEGRGGINGPDLSSVGTHLTLLQLIRAVRHPEVTEGSSWVWVTVMLRNGHLMGGFARNRTQHSIDLQTPDGQLHPLSDTQYRRIIPDRRPTMPPFGGTATELRDLIAFLSRLNGVAVGPDFAAHGHVSTAATDAIMNPKPGDWSTYSGNVDGNRFSPLTQINTRNISSLRPAWVHPLPYAPLETTPLVVGGIMYVTGPNQIDALDGRTGSQIWKYSRPRSVGSEISGDAARGANRGVAVLGDRLYFITDNAHLICLQRITGALLWDVPMVPPGLKGRYGGTSAPLIAGKLVIAGVSGADAGIHGFVPAYNPITGQLVWRFWTVPKPGDPTYSTWGGDPNPQGGSSWTTGSYDPKTGIFYIGTGNPYPDTDGDDRPGPDLYTDSDLALDVRTGKLLWYFQFTPHDLHDWDANQPVVLVNAPFHGRVRHLLLHANRNGFLYVLDRLTGKYLQATPMVKRLNWASGIDAAGKPILLPANQTSFGGTETCPAVRGATNWYSTAYDPQTGLYYVMTVESCSMYTKAQNGGYGPVKNLNPPSMTVVRAFRIDDGKVAWSISMLGRSWNKFSGVLGEDYSGVLATAGGLVFYGETSGAFAAADARTGRNLWHFQGNQEWKSNPMTYLAGGWQYVAIASGPNIISFALTSRH
jgi:PQQ-dependent dehydrogenase (methanol/ethanol family)